MTKLEDIKRGTQVNGIIPNQAVTVVDVQWHGANAVELFFKRADGQPGTQLLYRENEAVLELVQTGRIWSFEGDGNLLRLVSEAYRIHLAHLFDPVLAVHTSLIEPLPHQITAVYGEMLTRQPLRYLLADDPGAGKTIMAGLFIKELIIRGDVRRCLICVPGSLCEQWQDELWSKFQLPFSILTRETIEASRTGNPFTEADLVIVRLDQVSRSDELQDRLRVTDWDLVICDEAHKLSASFFGGELKETKRYRLGKLLGSITRHFLLMTATPHNGKEEDFQLFLALLDADRFEGRFRDGVHTVDTSDLMRRMIKERLLRFDGRPLFPERRAYTVDYHLSDAEARLYHAVTEYVREEFNRADQLQDDGGRKGTVGFALTILQRRLASSPEAIYQSLKRRRERLEDRLREERLLRRGAELSSPGTLPMLDEDALDELDDAPDAEVEAVEEAVIDSATAARTIAELEAEIETLRKLEGMAFTVRRSGTDRKWEELSSLMQTNEAMRDPQRGRNKLVVFTEHRDTLNYLWERITTLLGREDAVVCIHGGLGREDRRGIEESFRSDPDVVVLIATDAAGEGINLQRAHLMVNYDLPWNPNRLEQRFGRIHRIGQTEVCHLWNLVAGETREGHVYKRLLHKLETEREALDGQVFDVLGRLFEDTPLRRLLVEAIRYGDRPDVRAKLEEAVDNAVDRERVRDLLETRSLAQQTMDVTQIVRIREDMERAAARRLQPHYIQSFFVQAFEMLGGTIREREPGRFQITHVPAAIRSRDRQIGTSAPVLRQYERVCFDKSLIQQADRPPAAFVCPGHPLLDCTIDLILERHRDILRRGAVLIDPTDPGTEIRALFYLEQSIHDARIARGERQLISREVHFVEIDGQGNVRAAGSAPYLDYRPATEDELVTLQSHLAAGWLAGESLETQASSYAVEFLIPRHLERVRTRRTELIDKTRAAVQERLTKEINYWDFRANELRQQEQAGKPNAKINSARAQQRADELAARLQRRMEELEQERQISAAPPVIIGGALIVPAGLLWGDKVPPEIVDRRITEQIAMRAVLETEIALGHDPRDVSAHNLGYDMESRDGRTGQLRFIEVKGRRAGAETVTITRNEILTGLNAPDKFILALVEVQGGQAASVYYVRQPFGQEPDFGVTSVNYNIDDLLDMSEEPG